MRRDPLNVVTLAYDGLCMFEFGIVTELFGRARPEFASWYRLRVARVGDGPLRATGGVSIDAPYTLRVLDTAGTIVVPGWPSDGAVPAVLRHKLRRAHDQGARIVSVCSGVFVLAEAGLLDGKRAATHWRYSAELARRYPAIAVDPDVLYVDEGNVITSAGSAAGIDMGLHLIRRDFGAEVANAVARRLVVPAHRDGGQKQYVESPLPAEAGTPGFAAVVERLTATLSEAHSIESMARSANMSSRTFARRFKDATGTTPHRWLQAQRVRLAQRLLETTALPIERIADECGFTDAQLLRLHFRRIVGAPPAAYRKRFRALTS